MEGTFRGTCEIAIRCMRENRDLVMSILESLLYISYSLLFNFTLFRSVYLMHYDPFMDWRTFNRSSSSKSGTLVFSNILKVVENRLRGVYGELMIIPVSKNKKGIDDLVNSGRHTELSVQGQVDNVIKDATDVYNLMQMYTGWMPYV